MVVSRTLSGLIMITGFILMYFIEDYEILIWGAWPCLAVGAIANHIPNIQMCLAIPTFKGTLMAFFGGVFGAGGVTALIMMEIMEAFTVGISDIFLYWLIAYIFIFIIKIVFWTPAHIDPNIADDNSYSIFSNSAIISLLTKGDQKAESASVDQTKSDQTPFLKMFQTTVKSFESKVSVKSFDRNFKTYKWPFSKNGV